MISELRLKSISDELQARRQSPNVRGASWRQPTAERLGNWVVGISRFFEPIATLAAASG